MLIFYFWTWNLKRRSILAFIFIVQSVSKNLLTRIFNRKFTKLLYPQIAGLIYAVREKQIVFLKYSEGLNNYGNKFNKLIY